MKEESMEGTNSGTSAEDDRGREEDLGRRDRVAHSVFSTVLGEHAGEYVALDSVQVEIRRIGEWVAATEWGWAMLNLVADGQLSIRWPEGRGKPEFVSTEEEKRLPLDDLVLTMIANHNDLIDRFANE
jgi:hypothetical protein